MLPVVAYNYEDLSGTFGGLEGHPILLIVTAYIIGPPFAIYLGRLDLGLDRTPL